MKKPKIKKFNLRVYGLAINEKREVLLTDEFRLGRRMTKFPGGGMKPGEGTIDCLRRECREELGQEIHDIRHFYTTDYFQPTFLLPEPQQLISVYYLMQPENPEKIPVTHQPFDFEDVEGAQTFRLVKIAETTEDMLTFPIDKKVVGMLKKYVSGKFTAL